MSLIKWRPRNEWDPATWVRGFRDELDRLFERSLSPWRPAGAGILEGGWSPAVDVIEEDDLVIIRGNLPGMKKDEIDLAITDNVLTIRGEKKQESEVKKGRYRRIERSYGYFERAVPLPASVDADQVEASYRDGVLEIKVPKLEESRPKKIEIKPD